MYILSLRKWEQPEPCSIPDMRWTHTERAHRNFMFLPLVVGDHHFDVVPCRMVRACISICYPTFLTSTIIIPCRATTHAHGSLVYAIRQPYSTVLPDIQMMAELIHESDIASRDELRRRNAHGARKNSPSPKRRTQFLFLFTFWWIIILCFHNDNTKCDEMNVERSVKCFFCTLSGFVSQSLLTFGSFV